MCAEKDCYCCNYSAAQMLYAFQGRNNNDDDVIILYHHRHCDVNVILFYPNEKTLLIIILYFVIAHGQFVHMINPASRFVCMDQIDLCILQHTTFV